MPGGRAKILQVKFKGMIIQAAIQPIPTLIPTVPTSARNPTLTVFPVGLTLLSVWLVIW